MKRTLVLVGGLMNAAFVVFHIWLGWRFHQLDVLGAHARSLLEIFNVGGTLLIGFFAYAALFQPTEMLTSRLGRAVLVMNVLLYCSRALGEFMFRPVVSWLVVAVCMAMVGLHVVLLTLLQLELPIDGKRNSATC